MLIFLLVLLALDISRAQNGPLHLLPKICINVDQQQQQNNVASSSSSGDGMSYKDAIEAIKHLISIGNLSQARAIAYECILLIGNNNKCGASTNMDIPRHCYPLTEEEVVQAYNLSTNEYFRKNENYLGLVVAKAAQWQKHQIDNDDENDITSDFHQTSECWDGITRDSLGTKKPLPFGQTTNNKDPNVSSGSAAIERWNKCCSYFRSCSTDKESVCFDENAQHVCCELSEGLDNHLILPALREPMVKIRVNIKGKDKSELITIEQEGSLKMFDVAGVLWPAGYLLGLCLSNPIECGVPEVLDAIRRATNKQPMAVELGSGVGFPSICLAKALQYHWKNKVDDTGEVCDDHDSVLPIIVATDTSNTSLALTASNSYKNGVGEIVKIAHANHTDTNSLSMLSQQFTSSFGEGFDIVFGASLQNLFDGTNLKSASLWHSLDALLSKENQNAIVVLSHVRTGNEQIELPPASERMFECVRRVSGDKFGMKTRDGHSSDFEVVLLRRRR